MAKRQKGWFGADKAGLGQMNEHRPKSFIVKELVQNVRDEAGVTICKLTIKPVPGKPLAQVVCADDAPEGFYDLRHAFTLFAHTRKRKDPTKAGRFNMGDKQVLSLAKKATVSTTTGTVVFHEDGTREERKRVKRDSGSVFEAYIPMTRNEIKECVRVAKTILMPQQIEYRVNGKSVEPRMPDDVLHDVTLQTEFENEEGQYRQTRRKTFIEVYEPAPGEEPSIYELGIPVMPTGDRWHYNIGQRVPLNSDRDNVQPAFLQDVRAEVLNVMVSQLRKEDASEAWVRDGAADERIEHDALLTIADLRWGERRMVLTPGDDYGRERGIANGYHVVSPKEMSREEWARMREAEAIPASSVIFRQGVADGRTIPRDDWTAGMHRVERLSKAVSRAAFDFGVTVTMMESPDATCAAQYGHRRIAFNVAILGRAWFNGPVESILRLVIHELGHESAGNHLSEDYYDCLCRIGAALAVVDSKKFE